MPRLPYFLTIFLTPPMTMRAQIASMVLMYPQIPISGNIPNKASNTKPAIIISTKYGKNHAPIMATANAANHHDCRTQNAITISVTTLTKIALIIFFSQYPAYLIDINRRSKKHCLEWLCRVQKNR